MFDKRLQWQNKVSVQVIIAYKIYTYDPGHRRVYIESSEDGHWEVIDTEEAFC